MSLGWEKTYVVAIGNPMIAHAKNSCRGPNSSGGIPAETVSAVRAASIVGIGSSTEQRYGTSSLLDFDTYICRRGWCRTSAHHDPEKSRDSEFLSVCHRGAEEIRHCHGLGHRD